MLLYWYACILINTNLYIIYNILLEMVWWVLCNVSLIVGICLVISEIIANETCSYWWSDISVICCHFCTFYIYTNSLHLRLSSTTWFVRITLIVVEIQVE